MNVSRFRIVDLLLLVALAAFGALLFRDARPYERSDLTYILAPLVVSLAMCCLVATAIAARFGRRERLAARWGFLLGCGSYLVLTSPLGFDSSWAPVTSQMVRDGLGRAGVWAGTMGYTSASDFVQFVGFAPGSMFFG